MRKFLNRILKKTKKWLALNIFYKFSERLNYYKLQDAGKKKSLDKFCLDSVQEVKQAAYKIYQEKWNYYSNALTNDVVQSFYDTINFFGEKKLDYLEIGSAQGLSLAIVGEILRRLDKLGNLVSIDPYFEDGYFEGAGYFNAENKLIDIKSKTRDSAIKFRNTLNFDVVQIKETSDVGLLYLLKEEKKFDIIYIDGSHEGLIPIVDFGLCTLLLNPGGVIILDDYHRKDVSPLKKLCDKHCYKITESHKTVAYRVYEKKE